jgi:RNA polymerase-interacting CarD/CdnL/TRCF family regulator
MGADFSYAVNDWVVHTQYGVGQVKGVEVKPFHGEPTKCFKVKTRECTYWFPTTDADNPRIRPIASEEIIKKVVRTLRRKASDLDTDRKHWKRQIESAYAEGDMLSISKLIRDLSSQGVLRKLNQTEENALENFKVRLSREWAAIVQEKPQEIREQVEACLQVSTAKVDIEGQD